MAEHAWERSGTCRWSDGVWRDHYECARCGSQKAQGRPGPYDDGMPLYRRPGGHVERKEEHACQPRRRPGHAPAPGVAQVLSALCPNFRRRPGPAPAPGVEDSQVGELPSWAEELLAQSQPWARHVRLHMALIRHGILGDPWELVMRHAECSVCHAPLGGRCKATLLVASGRKSKKVVMEYDVHLPRLRVFLRFCLPGLFEQATEDTTLEAWRCAWTEGEASSWQRRVVVSALLERPTLIPLLAFRLPVQHVDPMLQAVEQARIEAEQAAAGAEAPDA